MADHHDTLAGKARLLHQQVKALRAKLKDAGYPVDSSYMILMNVVLRLAYEEHGDDGVYKLKALLDEQGFAVAVVPAETAGNLLLGEEAPRLA